ncbi:MAG TPA: DUF1080 domain-containing protein [Opitutae bacterium]|nr:hypothetical protein [Opitutae bacterium]HAF58820.1 DUF1080 domain-containing protein [Opitutae bacterium]|tara:strand:- start:537 stop:1217 length:681 start_codon:yes stop_codon:yes gene_type:complete
MKHFITIFALLGLAVSLLGEQQLFNGKTLEGWDGNPIHWSVEDGAIVGVNTKEKPTKGNTFLIWKGGNLSNFDLTLECKIDSGNSGIQYRSFIKPGDHDGWRIGGYQADFESGDKYSGICYGEAFRGILCLRGDRTILSRDESGKLVKSVEKIGETSKLGLAVKKSEWNTYRIVADGFRFEHFINGQKMCELIDEDVQERRTDGLLALQVHAGPPMKVYFRNIILH